MTPKGEEWEFEELGRTRTFATKELQESSERNVWTESRLQFRVWWQGLEAAFVTFDIWPEYELNLYEMVVSRELRRQGIGSAIVRFALLLAEALGKSRLTIRAGQIGETRLPDLHAFYRSCGLKQYLSDPNLFSAKV